MRFIFVQVPASEESFPISKFWGHQDSLQIFFITFTP